MKKLNELGARSGEAPSLDDITAETLARLSGEHRRARGHGRRLVGPHKLWYDSDIGPR
jgi:hypothetical protein